MQKNDEAMEKEDNYRIGTVASMLFPFFAKEIGRNIAFGSFLWASATIAVDGLVEFFKQDPNEDEREAQPEQATEAASASQAQKSVGEVLSSPEAVSLKSKAHVTRAKL